MDYTVPSMPRACIMVASWVLVRGWIGAWVHAAWALGCTGTGAYNGDMRVRGCMGRGCGCMPWMGSMMDMWAGVRGGCVVGGVRGQKRVIDRAAVSDRACVCRAQF